MKSWKTSVGGILTSLGLLFHNDPAFSKYADLVAAVGSLLLGLAARDNNVTSEAAGAKPPPPAPPPAN